MTVDISARIDTLIEKYGKYGKSSEFERIRTAAELAAKAHEGQFRQSGEPYVCHPISVAEIVADMEMDADSIIAALLHDTVEDTDMTDELIRERFGDTVADLVDGLTKLASIPYSSKVEQEMENLRKMFIAMARDIRVILIKLADRLHNIRTLDAKPPAKQREIALETMDVYSPIAHRLGVTRLKCEIEDLALRYLDPVGYEEIITALERQSTVREDLLHDIIDRLRNRFAEHGMGDIHIEGRVKDIYSIYRKMFMQNKTIAEVYDLYAVRIIVDTKDDCYNILGIIHDMYKPIPGRFKDYISTPKPNLYQSLHTTVIGRAGIPFEVQIRTWDMHHIAEYGIAAHWKYKQGLTGVDEKYESKLEWIRKMLETQQDTDAEDFLSTFKIDMFADEVFVFTPKGDVINLPVGSTPIDFAYAIHSEIGNRMIGAKVNSRMVQIDHILQNGDIVEIVTSKASRGPSRDWLKIVKTNEAGSKIKQWFKKEKREENITQGREAMVRELKRLMISPSVLENEELVQAVIKKLSFNSLDELLAGVGYGGVTSVRAANRVREEYTRLKASQKISEPVIKEERPLKKSDSGVIVEGMNSCLVKFARCCTPVPGDDIVGFVTRGYGVSVHCADCVNVTTMDRERMVGVRWADVIDGRYTVGLDIHARNRVALIADLSTVLANQKISIHSLRTREIEDDAVVSITVSVSDRAELDSVCSGLHRVAGVTSIERSGSTGGVRL
ncbi:MAG: bifunctional (p)ppGpp synthetase/guanosine-3',5'-bis(diphosphate) 3'-pyrophosphohydrolase [Clostridia bacterium]|nr:bifunctional (p)ppGpp synthetase/guanosine-3',5'-bis(diphosphate) 3'-pyrophosphohydrolase [Clostridia bacterium]